MSSGNPEARLWGGFTVPEGRGKYIDEYSPRWLHQKAMKDLRSHPDYPAQMAAMTDAGHTPVLKIIWNPTRYAVGLDERDTPPSYLPNEEWLRQRRRVYLYGGGQIEWGFYEDNPWENPGPVRRAQGALRRLEIMYWHGDPITEKEIERAARYQDVPVRAVKEWFAYWLEEQTRINDRRIAEGKTPAPPLPSPDLALIG